MIYTTEEMPARAGWIYEKAPGGGYFGYHDAARPPSAPGQSFSLTYNVLCCMVPESEQGTEMRKPKVKYERIDCADLNSSRGANLLKDVIRKYWLDRGCTVRVEAYPLIEMAGKWGVRSNLVNGLPPKHLALRA